MIGPLERKRLMIYLALCFGVAWLAAAVIYLTGGITDSLCLVPGTQVTLALVLMAGVVMMAPTFANILTRIVTREGKHKLLLRPGTKARPLLYWLLGWFLTAFLILLGGLLFFVLFPAYYDADHVGIQRMIVQQALSQGIAIPQVSGWVVLAGGILQAVLFAPILNGLFTYGEEFGWRGYLLPKLMPLGGRKAVLLSGVIWGIWHAPLIAMGHNYGTNYAGYPWLGILMMTIFCMSFGCFVSWLTLKEGSIWPAVIAHAVLNGLAGISLLLLASPSTPILGPLPVNLIGGLPFLAVAILLLLIPGALNEAEDKPYWKPEHIATPPKDDNLAQP